MKQEKEIIVSQATILVLNRKVLLLERKLPYGIADNLYSKYQRQFTFEEKRNIVLYYCGKIFAFEDKFDFPKGRGKTFKHALKEVEEETGYKVKSELIYKTIEHFDEISYVGFDNKNYKIIFHLVFLKDKPSKIRKGETLNYISKWINLEESVNLLWHLNDRRNKFSKYFILLKNILQICVEEKIF